jgi:hypothetical protein
MGMATAAKMPMIDITNNNSMSENPPVEFFFTILLILPQDVYLPAYSSPTVLEKDVHCHR